MALITLARAQEQIPNFNTADNATLTDILNASSDTIERYCNRTFAVTDYDEIYDGQGTAYLHLNNYPVTKVSRIAYNLVSVFQIQNTEQANSRAVFRLDATKLYLSIVRNAVTTNREITLATVPMLSDLATAVNAFTVSDGWKATALGVYATWPTADLHQPQGGNDLRWYGAGFLKLHAFSLPDFEINPTIGELVSRMGFSRGYRNYRVVYTAGFADSSGATLIPYPVQQACAELTAATYHARGQNLNLAGENLGGYSYTALAAKTFDALSLAGKYGLSLYRKLTIPKFRV